MAISWEICGAKTYQKTLKIYVKTTKGRTGSEKKGKKTLEIHIQIKILNLLQDFCEKWGNIEDPKVEQAKTIGNMCKAIKT